MLSHQYVFILATPFSYFFLPTISFWCMILRHWYGCLCLNKKLCHEHIQTFNIYQSHGNPNAYEHMKPWWRHQMETFFSHYWPFVWGIHRSPVNSPHRGQWRGALMFSLICVGINGWIKNPEAGDLRCYCTHYDISVMFVEPNLANVCDNFTVLNCLEENLYNSHSTPFLDLIMMQSVHYHHTRRQKSVQQWFLKTIPNKVS